MRLFWSPNYKRPKCRWDYLKVLTVGGITVTLMYSSLAVMQNNAPLEMSVETAATKIIYEILPSNFQRVIPLVDLK
jgi:hypothetical protein